jgi:hypothetical protein
MRLLNLLSTSILISFGIAVTPVQAKALDDHTVLCPNIEKVRQAAPLILRYRLLSILAHV